MKTHARIGFASICTAFAIVAPKANFNPIITTGIIFVMGAIALGAIFGFRKK